MDADYELALIKYIVEDERTNEAVIDICKQEGITMMQFVAMTAKDDRCRTFLHVNYTLEKNRKEELEEWISKTEALSARTSALVNT